MTAVFFTKQGILDRISFKKLVYRYGLLVYKKVFASCYLKTKKVPSKIKQIIGIFTKPNLLMNKL